MQGTIAIDLGSSTTVVAYQDAAQAPRLLPLPPYSLESPCVVPSLLWLSSADTSKPLLGRQVLEAGLGFDDSPGLQRDFKRRIGSGQPANPAALPLSPEAAGERLMLALWQALPAELEPARLVLTAPIEAYAGYRSWLLQLAERLAVPEIALVDEPTAAAIGCGLAPGSRVLVVDLGGGTSDLSLVQIPGGEGRAAPIAQLLRLGGRLLENSRQSLRCARVLGKAGLAIGGRDVDRWIAASLCPGEPLQGALLAHAEALKCQLSAPAETAPEQARSLWSHSDGSVRELQLSQRELDAILEHHGLMDQLDALLDTVLAQGRANGIDLDQIDAVLPVGGSSQLKAVQHWLRQRLGRIPLHNERPVEAVALGALALTPGVQLRDVLNQGVSLRCWDQRSGVHQWHPLYVPGQSWPTEHPLELVLACSRDGQESLELVLGEPQQAQRAEVVYSDGLPVLRSRAAGPASVRPWPQQPAALPLDPPGVQGQDRLRLSFSVDAQAQLIVAVQDLLDPSQPLRTLCLGPVR